MSKHINKELGIETGENDNEEEEDEEIDRKERRKEKFSDGEEYFDACESVDEEKAKNGISNIDVSQNYATIESVMEHMKSNKTGKEEEYDDFMDNLSERSFENFESKSVRSTATSIHPEEIKKRVKKQFAAKDKRDHRKKCVAKGEASAITRTRRENFNTIKQSKGIWGYDD